jgi:hypothetical protein
VLLRQDAGHRGLFRAWRARLGRRSAEELRAKRVLVGLVEGLQLEGKALLVRRPGRLREDHERLVEAVDVDLEEVRGSVDGRALEREMRELVRDRHPREVAAVTSVRTMRRQDG